MIGALLFVRAKNYESVELKKLLNIVYAEFSESGRYRKDDRILPVVIISDRNVWSKAVLGRLCRIHCMRHLHRALSLVTVYVSGSQPVGRDFQMVRDSFSGGVVEP